ncbi:MAG: tetratricopeptide repeat protein [Bacteroidia bacterium]|nr:tetratricopeptide repeat protein [Bacteroidia bacterium]
MSNWYKYGLWGWICICLPYGLLAQWDPAADAIRAGNRAFAQQDFAGAELAYRQALALAPQDFRAAYNLANTLYQLKQYQPAAAQFAAALQAGKTPADKARAALNLGNTWVSLDNLEQAAEAYKAALRHNPRDEDARFNLAWVQQRIQQQAQNPPPQQQQNQPQQAPPQPQTFSDNPPPNQPQQQQPQSPPTPAPGQRKPMSEKDIERMLEALRQEEEQLQQDLQRRKVRTTRTPNAKDW